jgi:nicotinate-nucleotide adenylyltransferase
VSWTPPVLLFGGTFDPVHDGHVAIACCAAEALAAARVLLLPGGDPPHRGTPRAAGWQRAAMLRLAFAGDPRFVVDERELQRAGPSYSVDTVAALRAEQGAAQPLVFLLGRDAAAGLPRWHQPERLPGLCHLLVVARPGGEIDAAGPEALGWRALADCQGFGRAPAGGWCGLARSLSTVSSTAVRAALAAGRTDDAGLPPAVARYIQAQGLYRGG